MDDFDMMLQITANGLRTTATPDMIQGWQTQLAPLSTTLRQFKETVQTVNNSGDFTEQGRTKRLTELAQTTLKEVRGIGQPVLERYAQRVASEERALVKTYAPTPRSDSQQLLEYLRGWELRTNFLDPHDPIKNEVAYLEALSKGDIAMISAVENAPYPAVRPELLEERKQQKAEAQDPEGAAQLRALRALKTATESILSEAKRALQPWLPPEDAIARMANGAATDELILPPAA